MVATHWSTSVGVAVLTSGAVISVTLF